MSHSRGRRRPAARPAHRSPASPDQALERALDAAQRVAAPTAATFAELGVPPGLVRALARRGIDTPFAIQARTLADALAGRDVLGRAQTGSGKTLAFGLPILTRLAGSGGRPVPRSPRALVLVPTRELAGQVTDALAPLGQALGLRVAAVYGGVSLETQAGQLRHGVDVCVATPGRLLDLLDRGRCTLGSVEITVLDEADHLADLGFLPAVMSLLDLTPAGGQRLLFSATLDRDVDRLVRRYLTNPAVHAVAPAAAPVQTAEHQVFVLPAADKVAIAAEIAGRAGRTLFFVRTKRGAARLARRLTGAGVAAAAIHGDLTQSQRQRALAGFAAGHPAVLVATDVAARGIHVDDVELVVHFDPPNDHKGYLHRSGRTARAGAAGTVLALAEPGQVAELAKLHRAAGVTPTTETVRAGDRRLSRFANPGPAGRPGSPPAAGRGGDQPPSAPNPAPASRRQAHRRRRVQRPATSPPSTRASGSAERR